MLLSVIACGGEAADGPLAVTCGDGSVAQATESCDDGNQIDGDGCSSDCLVEVGFDCDETNACHATCGDGLVVGPELCDGISDGEYCSSDCTEVVGYCGDGLIQAEFGEECDIPTDSMGMGGSDGVDASANAGCAECLAASGYLCDSAANSCQQTGVDRSELAQAHPYEVCELIVGLWGGPGNVFRCTISGTAYDITVNSVSECESSIGPDLKSCTIAEVEDWLIGKSKCESFTGSPSCAL